MYDDLIHVIGVFWVALARHEDLALGYLNAQAINDEVNTVLKAVRIHFQSSRSRLLIRCSMPTKMEVPSRSLRSYLLFEPRKLS